MNIKLYPTMIVFFLLIGFSVSASINADVKSRVVRIFVSVVDNKGQAVTDLRKDNFVLYEDKTQQQLDEFLSGPSPVSLGIIVDTSGSMRQKFAAAIAAARYLVRRLRTDDEACVLSFKKDLELASAFTKNPDQLDVALIGLSTSGGSSIVDATYASAHYVLSKGQAQNKALLLFTDGLEKNSVGKEKNLIEALQKNGVRVFIVALTEGDNDSSSLFGKSSAQQVRDFVTHIAEDTGGQVIFPKKIGELQSHLDRLLNFIQNPYVLAYDPTNSQPTDKHRRWKIELQGITGRKLKVIAPLGYYRL